MYKSSNHYCPCADGESQATTAQDLPLPIPEFDDAIEAIIYDSEVLHLDMPGLTRGGDFRKLWRKRLIEVASDPAYTDRCRDIPQFACVFNADGTVMGS